MKQRIIALLCAAVLCLGTASALFDPEMEDTTVVLQIGSSQMAVNGALAPVDDVVESSCPIAQDGHTLVPVSCILRAFGGESGWDAETNKVKFTLYGRTVSNVIGSSTLVYGSKKIAMDVPSAALDGRTYVPMRYVLETLRLWVGYEPEHRLIVVSTRDLTQTNLVTLPGARALLEEGAEEAEPGETESEETEPGEEESREAKSEEREPEEAEPREAEALPWNGSEAMKYSPDSPPLRCTMTQSTCFRQTTRMEVKGVLWHSTGTNNPRLSRYVQPDDDAPDREAQLELLGVNTKRQDWNHIEKDAGLNAWIGKLSDGTVAAVQTMPWSYRPWGCGYAAKGSCNDGWIQFEICEDNLKNPDYFHAVYEEAVQLTAYLCTYYGIDPNGTADCNGVTVPTILCHADSHALGLGSNHADINHWLKKYGMTMENVREDVARLMAE